MTKLNEQLNKLIQSLDISPTDYERAKKSYESIGSWLETGHYNSGNAPSIFLQGSFRLGTVVRPYYADKDGDYDIDQVCELTQPSQNPSSRQLKHDIGDRLKSNGTYEKILDQEGKRCWTLNYASADNRPGFHLDILPSLSDSTDSGSRIKITNKDKNIGTYSWSHSDPNGYYYWFKSKNEISSELILEQSRRLFEANNTLYENIESVPKRLIRTPLQRTIQLLKRHRDIHFSNKDYKPISIIITTIAAHLYDTRNITETINAFVDYVLERQEFLLRNGSLQFDGILDYSNSEWQIMNPADQHKASHAQENFADRWNDDAELPMAFFDWVRSLKRGLGRFQLSEASEDLNLKLPDKAEVKSYPILLTEGLNTQVSNKSINTNDLLKLIHMGIDGEVSWSDIENVAQKNFDFSNGSEDEDVSRVNFYQIARHQGSNFRDNALADIKRILAKHPYRADFKLCCNLLLGSATKQMIIECMNSNLGESILDWPILRLANPTDLLP